MQAKIDISVIIPVYGVEKYLQECIDSLMAQNKKNMEFIFVNDASPDNCLQILRENEKKYGEVLKVIDSPENLRQGGARNLGIKVARGEYIGFVDSDDWVSPNMYQTLWGAVKKEDADAAFINCVSAIDKKDCCPHKKPFIDYSHLAQLSGKILTDDDRIALMCAPGAVWSAIWRKSIIIDNNILFPEKLAYEDNYWTSIIKCYLNKIVVLLKKLIIFIAIIPPQQLEPRIKDIIMIDLLLNRKSYRTLKKEGYLSVSMQVLSTLIQNDMHLTPLTC